MDTQKRCVDCGQIKPLTEFFKNRGMPDGRLRRCKPCHKVRSAGHKVDEERVRDRAAARYAARKADPDFTAERNTRARARYAGLADDQKAARLAARRERVARERAASGDGFVRLQDVLDRDGMICHICGSAIEDRRHLDFDHIMPLVRGGEHSLANLAPSHRRCNRWKGARLMSELNGLAPATDDAWDERVDQRSRELRSAAMKEKWANDPEFRAKMAARAAANSTFFKGNTYGADYARSEEGRKVLSERSRRNFPPGSPAARARGEAIRRACADPAVRERLSAAQRARRAREKLEREAATP